ncbi:hypothetical protein ACFO9Q_21925 [Paenibacillus sp. GCM10023252]|uniref:hypothetical protein n=1 Tax=Paenibacillus sp. GCM10023252 TaxID=3252649 RepID=UPI00361E6255
MFWWQDPFWTGCYYSDKYYCSCGCGKSKDKCKHNDKSSGDRSDGSRGNRSNGRVNGLGELVGQVVKINRGGPESIQGKLLAVKSDYLVLLAKEGVVYVSTDHIKSVTVVKDGNKDGNLTNGGRDPFIQANNFRGVLRQLTNNFVQMNWGGPEKVEGFLAEVRQNTVLLVTKDQEIVRVQISHIRSIKKDNKNNKSDNQSGGNKSGSKSGGKSRGQVVNAAATRSSRRTGSVPVMRSKRR